MAASQDGRTTIFVSYSHKDERWLERLRVYLRPLERDFPLDVWHDKRIPVGAQWRKEIKKALREARVAVLLVSADFFASDFIYNDELPTLLNAAHRRGLLIFSLILNSSARFSRHKQLSQFQTVNPPSQELLNLSRNRRERYFEKVSLEIEDVLRKDAIRAASSGIRSIERIGDQMIPLMTGKPAEAKRHRMNIKGDDSKLVAEVGGQVVRTITAEDLKKLPNSKLEIIRVYEKAMKSHEKRWKELYARRVASPDRRANQRVQKEINEVVAAMKDDLNGVLSFLEAGGMFLDDHYMLIRHLANQAAQSRRRRQ